jgi:hypothetical protein
MGEIRILWKLNGHYHLQIIMANKTVKSSKSGMVAVGAN